MWPMVGVVGIVTALVGVVAVVWLMIRKRRRVVAIPELRVRWTDESALPSSMPPVLQRMREQKEMIQKAKEEEMERQEQELNAELGKELLKMLEGTEKIEDEKERTPPKGMMDWFSSKKEKKMLGSRVIAHQVEGRKQTMFTVTGRHYPTRKPTNPKMSRRRSLVSSSSSEDEYE
eukprot:gene9542-1695_t